MSDCALFPASTSRYRVGLSWADKESVLSLDGRDYTFIVWTVKIVLGDLSLLVIYGLVTVIHHQTNRTTFLLFPWLNAAHLSVAVYGVGVGGEIVVDFLATKY